MKRFALLALSAVLILISSLPDAARSEQVGVIQLTGSDDIRQVSAMEQALDRMSSKVMQCVRMKLAPSAECFCLYPKALSDVKSVYLKTIALHPEWKDRPVSYMSEGKTYLVSFGGVGRQLATKCPARN